MPITQKTIRIIFSENQSFNIRMTNCGKMVSIFSKSCLNSGLFNHPDFTSVSAYKLNCVKGFTMPYGSSVHTILARFKKDESGSQTVEFIIWTPLLTATLLLIVDFSYLMVSNASMWNAARNTARAVSLHRVMPNEAEVYLRENLFFDDAPYDVTVRAQGDEVEAFVSVDTAKTALTPVLGRYVVGTMEARVTMLREPE
ncbi:TadE/TadG family type IV pilus assembly protein [Thalassococcus sp. BH17M4-6]|uniref:TadE/TadG family type IV pilus assembly protein n=1 Tax=Thalassococcus sp. BH17M4-6 TaxID=3413148 RepID=UPI003BEE93A8